MILGLSFSHNATACVLDEKAGRVLFCCSEERFSRRKNEWGIPYRALEYVFGHVARPEQIESIAVGESCRMRYGSREFASLMNLVDYGRKDDCIRVKARLSRVVFKEVVGRTLGRSVELRDLAVVRLRALGLSAPIEFTDHHAAHAASAYYGSPFDEALVLTLDGEGDGLSGSCWSGKRGRLERLESLPEEASVGLFYKSVTAFLGFKVNQQEGKVTGLASYGDPKRFAEGLRPFLHAETVDGRLRIVSEAADRHMSRLSRRRVYFFRLLSYVPMAMRAREWEPLFNQLLRREFCDLYGDLFGVKNGDVIPFSVAADIAAAAQQVFEDAALAIVRHCQDRFPSKNVALAGGVFANVRLNQRILALPGVENVYVHPGMGDEGLALGGALFHANAGGREKSMAGLDHVFVGPAYDNGEIRNALEAKGVEYAPLDDDALIEQGVRALQEGLIVGLFRGASEYGPRALGHRSILGNPGHADLPERLNERLRRSTFMPFAPAVLAECFDTLFSGPKRAGALSAARFMTIALDVDPGWLARIPAVVHADGTARPQTIRKEDDPFFHGLVRRFHDATGLGCVLNTSMNLHEEPLVNAPGEALRMLERGAVDVLILGGHLVRAGGVPFRL